MAQTNAADNVHRIAPFTFHLINSGFLQHLGFIFRVSYAVFEFALIAPDQFDGAGKSFVVCS
jgi:hypothetical protein